VKEDGYGGPRYHYQTAIAHNAYGYGHHHGAYYGGAPGPY